MGHLLTRPPTVAALGETDTVAIASRGSGPVGPEDSDPLHAPTRRLPATAIPVVQLGTWPITRPLRRAHARSCSGPRGQRSGG